MGFEVRTCVSAMEQREAVRPIWHYFGRSGPADERGTTGAPWGARAPFHSR
jgi:hypothetical protein